MYIYRYILSTHVSFHVDGTVTLKLSHIVFSEFVICFSGVTCRFVNLHRLIGSLLNPGFSPSPPVINIGSVCCRAQLANFALHITRDSP